MITDPEIQAATEAILARPVDSAGPVRDEAEADARAALMAVEPLIRARLARDVQAGCPKHLTRDYTPVDAAYDAAARIVRGDAS